MRALRLVLLAALAQACAGSEDNPTTVKDLRVLGIQVDPPELMGTVCDPERPEAALAFARPVTLTALIADPAGEDRDIRFELRACAWPGDRRCDAEYDSVPVTRLDGTPASGVTKAGELKLSFVPAALLLPKRKNEPLLVQVFEQDSYKGLGGLRMPLVLHLQAGDEEVYAMKLMVFSCRLFEDMKPNVNPLLPGLLLEGEGWPADPPRALFGPGPFKLLPEDFTALEEPYVVPSFELQPVHLEESWKLSWHATAGRMSPGTTGGTDPDGETSRHDVEWTPPAVAPEGPLTFYVVVRDGRGGTSWVTRTLSYTR